MSKRRHLEPLGNDVPRVPFCWECGKKLSSLVFIERKVDGHVRLLHVSCSSKLILRLPSYIYPVRLIGANK